MKLPRAPRLRRPPGFASLGGYLRPVVQGLARHAAPPAARARRSLRRLRPDTVGWALAAQLCLATAALALPAGDTLAQAASAHRHVFIADPDPAHLPAAALVSAEAAVPLDLAAATSAPTPALPTSGPPRAHQVFAFAPYWTLPSEAAFDVKDLTTVAYFGLDAAGDGGLVQSGPGWTGYQSQALVDLVDRAHAAGDRVVLSVECFEQSALDRLASDPAADQHLADGLIAAVRAKAMDGLNIDFEGSGAADRAGMSRLVGYLAQRVHGADPRWQVSVDTYGGSASDPGGFFDVRSMAPAVDQFFVMAYDMEHSDAVSPNAALTGTSPSDADVVASYTAAVPASKVILGVPFYGYQWATSSNGAGAAPTSGPAPVTYQQLRATGAPVHWDGRTNVPWTAWQEASGQWHEAYFDDPHSVALKARLADAAHLGGVGIWALGMDGNDPAMMAAVLGDAPPMKYAPVPAVASPSPAPAPGAAPAPGPAAPPPPPPPGSTTTTTRPPSSTTTTAPSGGSPPPSGGGSPAPTAPPLTQPTLPPPTTPTTLSVTGSPLP